MTSGPGAGGIVMIIAFLLYGIGGLMSLIGGIWLLVNAFQTGVGWGLAVLLLPFANIVFAVKHWGAAKKPFLLSLAGVALIIVALVVGFSASLRMRPVSSGSGETDARMRRAERKEAARKTELPQTDREKIADLLEDAGIDPAQPRTFKGRTIEAMTTALGTPSATIKAGDKNLYIFQNCFEVESSDGGKTVSGVHYMGQ